MAVHIGVIGDFNPAFASHPATNASFDHAAAALGIEVQTEWIPTPSLAAGSIATRLEPYGGLMASPGSPYQSFEGMLRGIEFARTRGWPFVGT